MSLQEEYQKEIIPKLQGELGRKNIFSVPRITKIVVSVGLKEALDNSKVIDIVSGDLMTITGQKPLVTRAKKAIATFKLREGDKIGLKVTLRSKKMYDFLEKLFTIVFPRVRDFRGVSLDSFDKEGNYTIGISEYTVFPEIDAAKVDKMRGLEITIVVNAKNAKESKMLFQHLGMPFKKK